MSVALASTLTVPVNSDLSAVVPSSLAGRTSLDVHPKNTEELLLEALASATEKGSLSPEILEKAFAIEGAWYHFSPFRGALARVLELPSTLRILEVGCGTGTLTRMLAEQGHSVVALDSSEHLAACARIRCEGFSNVEVITGSVEHIAPHSEDHRGQFDLILCVDPMLVTGEFFAPGLELLSVCRNLLTATGSFVLAVGNSLCSPASADVELDSNHVRGSLVSLGSVKDSLSNAGFAECETLLAFPHHAAPVLVVDPLKSREKRIDWDRLVMDSVAGSPKGMARFSSWWKTVRTECLDTALAPGWLLIAHAHTVHRKLVGEWCVKRILVGQEGESSLHQQPRDGVKDVVLEVNDSKLAKRVMDAAKPKVQSLQDMKETMAFADSHIEELMQRESTLRQRFTTTTLEFQDQLKSEQDSRRAREAELSLALDRSRALGSVCQNMREERERLRAALEEVEVRSQASARLTVELVDRLTELEQEAEILRNSWAYRLSQGIRSFFSFRR
jgi:SAM-dependent methyltransferase